MLLRADRNLDNHRVQVIACRTPQTSRHIQRHSSMHVCRAA